MKRRGFFTLFPALLAAKKLLPAPPPKVLTIKPVHIGQLSVAACFPTSACMILPNARFRSYSYGPEVELPE